MEGVLVNFHVLNVPLQQQCRSFQPSFLLLAVMYDRICPSIPTSRMEAMIKHFAHFQSSLKTSPFEA